MGILSMFKKKDVPPDVASDLDQPLPVPDQPAADSGEVAAVNSLPSPQDYSSGVSARMPFDGLARVASSIERLQIQMEALNSARGAANERFSRISEQIGELRTMIIENEKKMKFVDMNAARAIDIVEEIKPENLSKDIRKMEGRNDLIQARLEVHESITKEVVEELKRIRNQLRLFQGTEGILKLNEEVKDELISIQKLKAVTESHSDKVEKIFLEVQKSFSVFEKSRNLAKNVESSLQEQRKIIEGLLIKQPSLCDKKEFISLQENVNSTLDKIEEKLKKIPLFESAISSISSVAEKYAEVSLQNKKGLFSLQKQLEKYSGDRDLLLGYLEKLTLNVKDRVKTKDLDKFHEKYKEVKDDVKNIMKVLDTLVSVMERIKGDKWQGKGSLPVKAILKKSSGKRAKNR